jgi:thiol-disulfide isomerase/thioredoxin
MKMKTKLVLLLLCCVYHVAQAQFSWTTDMQTAKARAVAEGKLIVVDFWAAWCGPCKQMDVALWSTPEMYAIGHQFVALKVNIDYQKAISRHYAVNRIPTVLIINAAGEVLWRKEGMGNVNAYLDLLAAVPPNLKIANHYLLKEDKEAVDHFELGKAYQSLARQNDHSAMRSIFLGKSSHHFKKADKAGDEQMQSLAELHKILNKVYAGSIKKGLRKLKKIDTDELSDHALELYTFIEAYCLKMSGELEKFAALKEQLVSDHYLAVLEEN